MHPAILLIAGLLAALLWLSLARRRSAGPSGVAVGLLVLVLVALIVLSLRLHWGLALLGAAPLIFRIMRKLQGIKAGQAPTPGQTSTVETDYIRMVVNHDTGDMTGEVLEGILSGLKIESLNLETLLCLLATCNQHDPQGARVLKTFIQRKFPENSDWAREPNGGNGANEETTRSSGHMTRIHALEVLGLQEGASAQEIVDAHRRLMQKMHPDRGGSSYLAAEINHAKGVLLDRKES